MSNRKSELSLDDPSIRSLWGNGFSPPKSYYPLSSGSNRMHFLNSNTSPRSGISSSGERRGSAIFESSVSPMRKKSLGAYDLSNALYGSDFQSKSYSMDSPKRSSVPSLWDHSSGYSSGQPSPLYSSGSHSDFSSSDYSPSSSGGSSGMFGSYDHLNALENETRKEEIEMVAKLIRLQLMTRNESIRHRLSNIDMLLKNLIISNRRVSIASSGSDYLERERERERERQFEAAAYRRNQFQSELSHSFSNFGIGNWTSNTIGNSQQTLAERLLEEIEREAKTRRSSAYQSKASLSWEGKMVTRVHASPTYATKVFVGGLPYDVTPDALADLFNKFGPVTVQFPPRGRGHAYLVYNTEDQVKALLKACETKGPGEYFFWVSSRRGKDRQAQVIPWTIEDSDWLAPTDSGCDSPRSSSRSSSGSVETLSEPETINGKFESSNTRNGNSKRSQEQHNAYKQNTVFVGALHGEITAVALQKILSDLFGPIVHVGIDTDKARYPNGSGRVTFLTRDSFRRAVLAEFVEVMTPRFSKTIQLDAYIEDGVCCECKAATPIFCRHEMCFCYYCPLCFERHREQAPSLHPPVMRNRNNGYNNLSSNSVNSSTRIKERSSTC